MRTIEKAFKFAVKPLVGSGIGRIKILADIYQKIATNIIPDGEIIDVQGFKIKVITGGYITDIATELLFKGVHEPVSTQIFKDLIQTGDKVVDVGANIGYFSLLASRLVGEDGYVYCFEPCSENVDKLRENIKLNCVDNISIRQVAASNKNGEADFYLSASEDARHSLIQTDEHSYIERVKTVMLDSVLLDKKVDFLKIDTEGNDFQVLQGAKSVINANQNIKILFEVYGEVLKKQNIELTDVWNYLISDLEMGYFYYVDDYNGKTPKRIDLLGLSINVDQSKLVCNLLCSREKIEAYE